MHGCIVNAPIIPHDNKHACLYMYIVFITNVTNAFAWCIGIRLQRFKNIQLIKFAISSHGFIWALQLPYSTPDVFHLKVKKAAKRMI